jgi:hypothetical protein
MKTSISKCFVVILFTSLLLAACASATPEPTPIPTDTPAPTATEEPTPEPSLETSEEMILAAWTALNNQEYADSARYANMIVDTFSEEAEAQQQALTQAPPVGAVDSKTQEMIQENWALNDVGTAYYILGRSQVGLGDNDAARAAFEQARLYPFARTWDPQGWFWSPSFGAQEELDKLP